MPVLLSRILIIIAIIVVLLGAAALYLDLHLYLRPAPADLDQAVQEQLEAAKLPGAAIVMMKDNQFVLAKGYGYANLESQRLVTPDTLFQIASVSKLVTATTLMRLYEQGQFSLDDDINAYLPFPVRNPRFPDAPITFRMLLAHTSSIQDGPRYNSTYTIGQSEDPTVPLGDFLQSFFTPGGEYYNAKKNFTASAPGTQYEYSNISFGLVGYLVERIAGQPFDQVSRAEVLQPLGMTASTWMYREVDKNQWAMPYGYDMLRRRYTPLGAYSFASYPDGALKTSANEFARFLYPFVNEGKTPEGQTFLQPETVAEMLKTQYPQANSPHGIAWEVKEAKNQAQHSGMDDGMASIVVINPVKKVALIIFCNGGGEHYLRSTYGFLQFVKNIAQRVLKITQP